jgi:outer membrane protein assembly factor BamB
VLLYLLSIKLTIRPAHTYYNGFNRTPLYKTYQDKNALFVWDDSTLYCYEAQSGNVLNQWHVPHVGGDPVITAVADDSMNLFFAGKERVFCFNPGSEQMVWDVEVADGPNCSSPVLYNGLLFMISGRGTSLCLNPETDEEIYRQRLKGYYFASPVATNGRIILCSDKGLLTTIAADTDYEKMSESDLNERILASPALTEKQLFIRTESKLYCIEKVL